MLQKYTNYPLHYHEDCHLLGVTAQGMCYVEEYYGGGFWAQHCHTLDGACLLSVDEGKNEAAMPLDLPIGMITPVPLNAARALHYVGGRYCGLREAEHLSEWVQPLPLMEKMALLKALQWDVPPPHIAGIAESRVLAEARLTSAGQYVVCRCVRLVRMFPTRQLGSDGFPYDYDTLPLYIAHLYDAEQENAPPLHEAIQGLGGVRLQRPLDCLAHDGRLYLADGGIEQQVSRVVVYTIG